VRMFSRSVDERPTEDEIRNGRLEVAPRCKAWTEIEDDLVPRGRGLFVSAGTDHVYAPVRGVVFATASVAIIADQAPYFFTVSPEGELRFYERHRQTWSELVERKARRGRR
jgi:hypothetical protein